MSYLFTVLSVTEKNKDDLGQLQMKSDFHLARKFWHSGVGVAGISTYYVLGVDPKALGQGLLVFAITAFIVEWIRLNKSKALNQALTKLMKPFMRESEKHSYSGFPFYALGVSLSLIFFNEWIALLSIFFLVFADPIGSYFGILHGTKKLIGNKSLEGSTACGFTCFFITVIYSLVTIGFHDYLIIFAFIAGAIGAISELVAVNIDDNLAVPILSAAGLTILNSLFHLV
ncbi:MAG: diacylglycerol/polyprenol kinase family protein [Bacteriovoracaceae bacterium]